MKIRSVFLRKVANGQTNRHTNAGHHYYITSLAQVNMNSHYDYATTLQIQTYATETLAMLSGYIQRLQIAHSS